MAVEIKFCGLTRPADAELAASLGASYVGAIFAGGPRQITPERAAEVFGAAPEGVRRVGVFAAQPVERILRDAKVAGLDVIQLHGEGGADRVAQLRRDFDGAIWSVLRVPGTSLPPQAAELIAVSDGLLLDAHVAGKLGGTGVALPWEALAADLTAIRGSKTIVLAGGLTPENVARAIGALTPDVVDVSSGVEDAPGLKNHDRMRAFRDAVLSASILT